MLLKWQSYLLHICQRIFTSSIFLLEESFFTNFKQLLIKMSPCIGKFHQFYILLNKTCVPFWAPTLFFYPLSSLDIESHPVRRSKTNIVRILVMYSSFLFLFLYPSKIQDMKTEMSASQKETFKTFCAGSPSTRAEVHNTSFFLLINVHNSWLSLMSEQRFGHQQYNPKHSNEPTTNI